MNQIINMVMRQVVRRLVTMGIDKGVDVMAERRGGSKELTPEQKKAAQENQKRAKQAMRMARRVGR
ncbi:MAG: hypothetical protein AAF340_08805 [Pseudomonadota bacterium]